MHNRAFLQFPSKHSAGLGDLGDPFLLVFFTVKVRPRGAPAKLMVTGQSTAVAGQLMALTAQPTAVFSQLPLVNHQTPPVTGQIQGSTANTAGNRLPTAVSGPPLTDSGCQSAVGERSVWPFLLVTVCDADLFFYSGSAL